jgi:hypothetical protein
MLVRALHHRHPSISRDDGSALVSHSMAAPLVRAQTRELQGILLLHQIIIKWNSITA